MIKNAAFHFIKHMAVRRSITASAFIFFFAQACSAPVKDNTGFIINGQINNLRDGKVVLAKLDMVTNERVNIDSAEVRNGKFVLKGRVAYPYLHTLFFNNHHDKIHFFLENSPITITADSAGPGNAVITGSREDSLFHSMQLDDIFDRRLGMEIMLNKPDYCFAAFTAYYQFQIYNIHADTLNLIMEGFSEPVRQSEYYAQLNKLYETLRKVAISKPAPDFSIPDTSGQSVSLGQFRGQYVLLDFWASWCAPCRAANPKLVDVYHTFSGKNFTIIGISVDKDAARWKSAIASDRLPWTNVSSLNGWDKVTDEYGVKAVPQNFLINPDGIIIDKNIDPEDLPGKLAGLLP
jgi:peroxiredoxin